MCGKRLKKASKLLSLFCLLSVYLFCLPCYAEVVLTEEEAQTILNEIEESKKDLTQLQTQLEDVKKDCNEQKISYEKQLSEAEKKNDNLETAVTVTTTSTIIFAILFIVFAFI